MKVKIDKLDNYGRGICYVNNKITFVPNSLPDEIVDIELTKEKKKYNEGRIINTIKCSNKRVKTLCPFYNICGGCSLMHLSYNDTLKFKEDKLKSILFKYASIDTDVEIIGSKDMVNYRNKVTLKVKNCKYGYYKYNTNSFVEINNCLLASLSIQKIFSDLNRLNVINGEVVIRSNYNDELLIIIKSKDKVKVDIDYLKNKYKITGIIFNDKIIYGSDCFVDLINNYYFQVSYDSFFQVNPYICSKLFDLVKEYTKDSKVLLDLYSGVGTLGIVSEASKIYGIEIIKNAVVNSVLNAKINNKNAYYLFGKVEDCIIKINDKIDTVIVDPPRAGLDLKSIGVISNLKPTKIIYVSCDPMTLARDLKILKKDYDLSLIKGLDMFPYTFHVECVSVLCRKDLEI